MLKSTAEEAISKLNVRRTAEEFKLYVTYFVHQANIRPWKSLHSNSMSSSISGSYTFLSNIKGGKDLSCPSETETRDRKKGGDL
jgi:hypothetical protein